MKLAAVKLFKRMYNCMSVCMKINIDLKQIMEKNFKKKKTVYWYILKNILVETHIEVERESS